MSNHPRPKDGGDFKFSRTTGQIAFGGNLKNNEPLSRISQGRQSWLTNMSMRSSSSNKTDFIRLNAERAIASRARQPKLQKRVDSPHGTRVSVEPSGQVPNFRNKSNYGKIPKYMRRRKTEVVRDSRDVEEKVDEIINIDEKMRYSVEEREQVVIFLQSYHKELNSKYQTLPLFIDTIGMRQRKHELEALMDEVQQAIVVMQSGLPIYRSDFPPQNSEFLEQWEERMEQFEVDKAEEAAQFQQGTHYNVVW